MAIKLDEKTELTVSLKNVIAIIVAVAMGSYAMFHIEDRISTLENTINKNAEIMKGNTEFRQKWKGPIEEKLHLLENQLTILTHTFEAYQNKPGRSTIDVQVLKVEIQHLKEQIQELKSRLK